MGFNQQNGGLMGLTRPGKRLHNELERSTMLLMGKSIINMNIAIENGYLFRGFTQLSMVDLSSSFFVHVYQAGLSPSWDNPGWGT